MNCAVFLSNECFATLVSVFSVGSTRTHENTVENKKNFHLMKIKKEEFKFESKT